MGLKGVENYKLSEIIDRIQAEIEDNFIGGVIDWADREYGNAWSNAIDRFENALALTKKTGNFDALQLEAENYKRTCLDLIEKYRKDRNKLAIRDLFDKIEG